MGLPLSGAVTLGDGLAAVATAGKVGRTDTPGGHLRILELSTESHVQRAFILPLARHLRSKGHDVTLACSDDPGEYGQSGIKTLAAHGWMPVIFPIRRRIHPFWDLIATWQLFRWLRAHPQDVLHIHTAKAGVIGRVAGWLARVPRIVYTAHAFPFMAEVSWWRKALYRLIERWMARCCDQIVVDSEAVAAEGLIAGLHVPMRVVAWGVDSDAFAPDRWKEAGQRIRMQCGCASGEVLVGTVARLVPEKGTALLVEAIARLRQEGHPVRGLIVGDGPERKRLEWMVRGIRLTSFIAFTGFQRRVGPYLAAMDMFVLPSRHEGLSVAVMEAMSMAKPVVVTRLAAFAELVIDGETGLYFEKGDLVSLTAALRRLLTDDHLLRPRLRHAARQWIMRSFTHAQMCEAYTEILCPWREPSADNHYQPDYGGLVHTTTGMPDE